MHNHCETFKCYKFYVITGLNMQYIESGRYDQERNCVGVKSTPVQNTYVPVPMPSGGA